MKFVAINPRDNRNKIECHSFYRGLFAINADLGRFAWRRPNPVTPEFRIPNFVFEARFIVHPGRICDMDNRVAYDLHQFFMYDVVTAVSYGNIEIENYKNGVYINGYFTLKRSNRYYFPMPYLDDDIVELQEKTYVQAAKLRIPL